MRTLRRTFATVKWDTALGSLAAMSGSEPQIFKPGGPAIPRQTQENRTHYANFRPKSPARLKRLHLDRTARCDCDYRHSREPALARVVQDKSQRPCDLLYEQLAAVDARLDVL